MTLWITDKGSENCEFCQEDYYEEAGYYCMSCDRPLCTTCMATVFKPRQLFCPECAKHDEEEES